MRTEWVAVPFVAALLLPPTAHADEPDLELSRDGRTWSSTLSAPLLDEDARLVPGTSTRSDVWVRNASGRTVTMTAFVRDSGTTLPDDVAARDDFRVSVADTDLTGARLSGCRIITRQALGPYEEQRVPIAVRLPSTSRNVSQDESLTLSLRVQLVAGEAADPCSDSGAPVDSGGSDDAGDSDDHGGVAPPERPGRVDTDGGFLERSVVADVLALGLVLALTAGGLRWRGRARRGRRAS